MVPPYDDEPAGMPSREERDQYGRRATRSWETDGIGPNIIRVRERADHLVVVPDIVAIDPGDQSSGLRVQFRTGGRRTANCKTVKVIGMRGSVRDDTAGSQAAGDYELASMSLQIRTQEGYCYVTNGETDDFATMWDLFRDNPVYDLDVIVPTDEIWYVTFQNNQPVATGHALTPSLTFECLIPNEYRPG